MSRTLRALATAAACVASVAACAAPAHAKTLDVVLAGDSFSSGSGNGLAGMAGGSCMRHPSTWGQLYAARARAEGHTVNVKNVACASATLKTLATQLTAVTPQTDLVLFTISGNDLGFVDLLVACFTPATAEYAACRARLATANSARLPKVQDDATTRLRELRKVLRPGARVVVPSYPHLAAPSDFRLRGMFGGSINAGQAVRELFDADDDAMQAAIATVNREAGYELAVSVPTKERFAGHEPDPNPYAENPASWIHEFGGTPWDWYHPKPAGYRELADAVFEASGPDGDFGAAR